MAIVLVQVLPQPTQSGGADVAAQQRLLAHRPHVGDSGQRKCHVGCEGVHPRRPPKQCTKHIPSLYPPK
eukprot:gene9870-biopygen5827